MTDLLKEIIEVDKAARARLDAAKEEKAGVYASIASEKDNLIREEKQKARKKAERISEQGRADSEKSLERLREKNKLILGKMEDRYLQNKEKWVDGIVGRVTGASKE